MTGTTVRIPTVADTVRTYLVRSLAGDEARWVRTLIGVPVVVLLILAFPRVDSGDSWPFLPLATFLTLCAVISVEAARREYQFGGPQRLVVAAGVTTFMVNVAILSTFIALSMAFGQEPGSSPLEALGAMIPTDLIIGGLLVLMFVLVAAHKIGEPGRKRSEAENQARIRAERLARGRAVRP